MMIQSGLYRNIQQWLIPRVKYQRTLLNTYVESRIDALTSKDKAKLDVFIYGYDAHAYNTYYYWKDKFPEVTLYPDEVEKVYEIVDEDIIHYIPKGTVIETPEGNHMLIEEYFNETFR